MDLKLILNLLDHKFESYQKILRTYLKPILYYTPGAVFTNIPILVFVLTLVVYHFNHMPDFISIPVSTILALKSSCRINILLN